MSTMSQAGSALVVALALTLGACAETPRLVPSTDFAVPPERGLLLALKAAEATPEQRRVILELYDQQHVELKSLDAAYEQALQQRYELDRLAPDFIARAETLTRTLSDVNAQRMNRSAAFEKTVADSLGAEQWKAWQDFWLQYALVGIPGQRPPEGAGRRRGP